MDKITELKAKRFAFLKRLYEITGGNQFSSVGMWELGNELGFEGKETDVIVQYLVGENLVEYASIGGGISITHWGVTQVEEALSEPNEATQYFPPINIINVERMIGSQIQQGTTNSQQSGSFNNTEIDSIKSFIERLKNKNHELEISDDLMSEMNAEIATVEAQTASSKPKNGVIRECLSSIRNILEGATGSIVATEIMNHFPKLF